MVRNWLISILLALSAATAWAADAPSATDDPATEKRVLALGAELRCLVCQNQTIADSHAELAVDLKNQIREMIQKGMSDKDIKDYMVQRYGDFVLYNPPVKGSTWMLWFGPFALLIGGLAFGIFKLRQRARRVAEVALSETDHARAAALLAGKQETGERS